LLIGQVLIGADLYFPGGITPVRSGSGANIVVDDDGGRDYATIQSAINNAVIGDILYVHAGTYNENIVVNKAITIIGNGSLDTIVSGGGAGDVVRVTASWVNISGLKIINSGSNSNDGGLELDNVDHCRVTDNVITNNYQGLRLISANYNYVANNQANSNTLYGVYITSSSNNTVDNILSSPTTMTGFV
jgi:parallel beta-helix repeat protein